MKSTGDLVQSTTKTNADEEVAQFLRESGVLRAMQQETLEVNLRRVANSQGLEVLHISHRHHPVVELSPACLEWD